MVAIGGTTALVLVTAGLVVVGMLMPVPGAFVAGVTMAGVDPVGAVFGADAPVLATPCWRPRCR